MKADSCDRRRDTRGTIYYKPATIYYGTTSPSLAAPAFWTIAMVGRCIPGRIRPHWKVHSPLICLLILWFPTFCYSSSSTSGLNELLTIRFLKVTKASAPQDFLPFEVGVKWACEQVLARQTFKFHIHLTCGEYSKEIWKPLFPSSWTDQLYDSRFFAPCYSSCLLQIGSYRNTTYLQHTTYMPFKTPSSAPLKPPTINEVDILDRKVYVHWQVDNNVTCGPVRTAELRSNIGINQLDEENTESPSVFQLPSVLLKEGNSEFTISMRYLNDISFSEWSNWFSISTLAISHSNTTYVKEIDQSSSHLIIIVSVLIGIVMCFVISVLLTAICCYLRRCKNKAGTATNLSSEMLEIAPSISGTIIPDSNTHYDGSSEMYTYKGDSKLNTPDNSSMESLNESVELLKQECKPT